MVLGYSSALAHNGLYQALQISDCMHAAFIQNTNTLYQLLGMQCALLAYAW